MGNVVTAWMTYTKISVPSNKQKSGKSEHRQMMQFVEKD
jgi:hypothetical protein